MRSRFYGRCTGAWGARCGGQGTWHRVAHGAAALPPPFLPAPSLRERRPDASRRSALSVKVTLPNYRRFHTSVRLSTPRATASNPREAAALTAGSAEDGSLTGRTPGYGAASSFPKRPWLSSFGPAVKKSVVFGPLFAPPRPKTSAQRPAMARPHGEFSGPVRTGPRSVA